MIIVPTPSLPSCQRFVAEHALTGLKFTRIIGVWQGFFGRFLQKIVFLMGACPIVCRSSLAIRGGGVGRGFFAVQCGGLLVARHIAVARYYISLDGTERLMSSCF